MHEFSKILKFAGDSTYHVQEFWSFVQLSHNVLHLQQTQMKHEQFLGSENWKVESEIKRVEEKICAWSYFAGSSICQ